MKFPLESSMVRSSHAIFLIVMDCLQKRTNKMEIFGWKHQILQLVIRCDLFFGVDAHKQERDSQGIPRSLSTILTNEVVYSGDPNFSFVE